MTTHCEKCLVFNDSDKDRKHPECMNSSCPCHTPVEKTECRKCGLLRSTVIATHKMCIAGGLHDYIEVTSTGGETVYVKAPLFYEPAMTISQSVVDTPSSWIEEFEKLSERNVDTEKEAKEVLKSFIRAELLSARAEAIDECISVLPDPYEMYENERAVEDKRYGAQHYRTTALESLSALKSKV